MGKTIRKTYEEVYDFYKSMGYELLDRVYINAHTKMTCIDLDGYRLFINCNNLQNSKTPRRFDKSNPYTIENIHHYIELNRDNVVLVKGQKYLGNTKNLKFFCTIHNSEFPMSWGAFSSQNQGCYTCGNERRSGENSYTKKEGWISPIKGENHHMKKLENRLKQSGENHFAKKEGWISPIKGENHPQWKGGISPLHSYLRAVILPWKNDSFGKYNGKCDIAGIKSTKKNQNTIHHLHPFNEILKETMNTLDLPIHQKINKYSKEELESIEELCLELHWKYGLGVCLTKEIHKELHLFYGGHMNEINKQQYLDFREIKLKEINNEKE